MSAQRSVETLPGQMMIIHFHNGANGRLFRRYMAENGVRYRATLLDDGELQIDEIYDDKTRLIEFFNTESWDTVRAIVPRVSDEE